MAGRSFSLASQSPTADVRSWQEFGSDRPSRIRTEIESQSSMSIYVASYKQRCCKILCMQGGRYLPNCQPPTHAIFYRLTALQQYRPSLLGVQPHQNSADILPRVQRERRPCTSASDNNSTEPTAQASLPRTNAHFEVGSHLRTGSSVCPVGLQDAINGGVFNPATMKTPFDCGTGNYTFPNNLTPLGIAVNVSMSPQILPSLVCP